MELERAPRAVKHVESVVVFQSGFAANAGTVAAVLTKDDVIISDELNHAASSTGPFEQSADQGLSAQGRRRRSEICRSPKAQKKILITDGVFSMDGDLGRVPELRRLPKIQRDHDGGRCACERGVWGERSARSITSGVTATSTFRSARCQRQSASSAVRGRFPGTCRVPLPRARPFLSRPRTRRRDRRVLAALDVLETEPQ